MKTDWLIIDGYSLIHRDPDLQSFIPHRFSEARTRLVRKLETASGVDANRITVVFDGQSGGVSYEQGTTAIEVYFSPSHATADTIIEQWVASRPEDQDIMVVTSDRLERETVTAAGAQCMSCAAFLDELSGQRMTLNRSLSKKRPKAFTLGDSFPDKGHTPE